MPDLAEVTAPASSDSLRGLGHRYSLGEEIASSVTHGIGIALACSGLTLLVVYSRLYGNGWHLGSSIVFGVTLILLYTASTLYHSIQSPRAKRVFRILDHSAIYLLIAGTYTPFTLVTLRGSGGWWLFGFVWTLAILGVVFEAFWLNRPKMLSAIVYMAMGWQIATMTNPLIANLPRPGLVLLIAGGATYTLGTVFYVLKKVRYMHAVWHVFVLGGSVCHFLAVTLYVLPR